MTPPTILLLFGPDLAPQLYNKNAKHRLGDFHRRGVSGEHKGLEGRCMSAKVKDEWK